MSGRFVVALVVCGCASEKAAPARADDIAPPADAQAIEALADTGLVRLREWLADLLETRSPGGLR